MQINIFMNINKIKNIFEIFLFDIDNSNRPSYNKDTKKKTERGESQKMTTEIVS